MARRDPLSLCPSLDCWKQQLMNVAGIIEKLRSELREIEDAILTLERFQPLTKAAKAGAESVGEIGSIANPSDAS